MFLNTKKTKTTKMENEVKINETHISTLKKSGKLLEVENIKLKFEFEDNFEELKIMAKNPNRNRCELERFIKNSALKVLLKGFGYCQTLDGVFQGIKPYITIDYTDYKKAVALHKENIKLQKKDGKELEYEMEKFNEKEKEKVIKELKKRKIAYSLITAYECNNNDDTVFAFSHQEKGFLDPAFKLGDDFNVIYKTNFGYGMSSYFYTCIQYKGIDIIPYSDLIKFKYANTSKIIKYTRNHELENSSWSEAFDLTKNLFNHSVIKPTTFVNEWIINECKEMVSGLEYLLNKNNDHEIKERELLEFKGEKISGSLLFLDKIKELTIFSKEKITSYIERIKNCNLNIYPLLKSEIITLKEELNELDKQVKAMKPNWKIINYKRKKIDCVN